MASISNAVIGALISQDLLLLANVFSGELSDKTEKLIVAIKLKIHLDLTTATPEDIVEHSAALTEFQTSYQEFILELIDEKKKTQHEYLQDKILKANRRSLLMFRQILGSLLIAISIIYIIALTWLPVPPDNQRFADTSLGFILATVISTIINFFFGNSENTRLTSTKDHLNSMNELPSNCPPRPMNNRSMRR